MVQRLMIDDRHEMQHAGVLTSNISGRLWLPHAAQGMVVFVDDRGLGCACPRQRSLAQQFGCLGLGTLRADWLSWAEARELAATPAALTSMLCERLEAVTAWIRSQPELAELPLGYFGLGLGATAALRVAAHDRGVRGVVIQHGLLDLAPEDVVAVEAPTLVLVNDDDFPQLSRYETLLSKLAAPHQLRWLPTMLDGQPLDPLTAIASLGGAWLQHYVSEHAQLETHEAWI